MRDIREDLQERLEAADTKRVALEAQIRELVVEVSLLKNLLAREDARIEASTPNGQKTAPSLPLPDFIAQALQNGSLTKDRIRELADSAGYFRGEESPGRTLHATLVNMTRGGRLTESDGTYTLRPIRTFEGGIPRERLDPSRHG